MSDLFCVEVVYNEGDGGDPVWRDLVGSAPGCTNGGRGPTVLGRGLLLRPLSVNLVVRHFVGMALLENDKSAI